MLRVDALHLGLGVLLLGVDVAALVVLRAAIPRQGTFAAGFGVFAFLYGLRLLARTDTFPPGRPSMGYINGRGTVLGRPIT